MKYARAPGAPPPPEYVSKTARDIRVTWVAPLLGEAHEVKFHTPEQFEKQVAESRALLPSMAVYQIHSATEASGVLDNEAVLARLAALRDGGVVAGLSVSHPQVPTIAKARHGSSDFCVITHL